jgi:hypothetical protein
MGSESPGGEGQGHPGLSDASAANTQGMAGPGGLDVDVSGIQSEALSFSPMTMGTVGLGHPGLSDAQIGSLMGLAGLTLGPANLSEYNPSIFGVNPKDYAMTPGIAKEEQGRKIDTLESLMAAPEKQASDNGGNSLLQQAPPALLPRPSMPQQASWTPAMQQIPNYQYGQGRWVGNQFIPAPIVRNQ